tara:strand:+ start:1797 stop:2888 length:1092 start_codon:yes stop_codon:yes gene_type:complete
MGINLKNIFKEGKVLSVFDFDDTIAKSDAWIYVTRQGRTIKKLDPAQFAVYRPRPGEDFNFKDFDRKIRNPRLIKRNAELLKKQLDKARKASKGARKVTILTARRLGQPVTSFLKSVGIDAYVVPLGSADPQKKADWIEKQIKKGYDTIYFMDDSNKNIAAVNNMLNKYPNVKSITKLIKETSSNAVYGADSGEPDTGFIHGGNTRKLGKLAGKPEPWFEGGDYTQMHWPEADHVFGKGFKADFTVIKTILSDIKNPKLKTILSKIKDINEIDYHSKLSRGHKPDYYQLGTSEFKPFDKSKDDDVEENFADGKKPGRKGISKRVGIPKGATLTQLAKLAKAKGEKGRMARWQLNMRRGKKKKK